MNWNTCSDLKKNKSVSTGLLFFLVLLLTPLAVNAQDETGAIKGKVVDRSNRQPIPAANVVIIDQTRGAAADIDGKFLIENLKPGIYHVMASALGYESYVLSEIVVTPGRSRNLEFLLQPTEIISEEVIIVGKTFTQVSPDLPTSTRNYRYEEIRRAPGAAEDVQRMVQALPGVVNQNDQTNQIVVRGGSPFENMTILDGIEVDNTNHFSFAEEGNGGGINGLNNEFLQDVTFAAGGFSARYGDRMSSILDLGLREGSREGFGGSADFGMNGIGGYIEGPIRKEKGSFLYSAHKSYLDFLPQDAVGLTSVPHYWNTQLKATYDLSPTQLLTVNGLYLEDKHVIELEDTQKQEEEEENDNLQYDASNYNGHKEVFGARLRSLWGHGFTDIIVGRAKNYVRYEMFESDSVGTSEVKHRKVYSNRTDIIDQLHIHYTGKGFNKDEWSTGISLKPTTYKSEMWVEGDTIIFNDGHLGVVDTHPDTFVFDDNVENVDDTILKYGMYLQYSWHPKRNLAFTGGIRYDVVEYSDESSVDPRLSMNWGFHPKWNLNLAWGVYHQAQDPSIYLDDSVNDANRYLPNSKATQYIAGLNFNPRPSTLISLEGYYKDYDNLLVSQKDVVRETLNNYTFDSDVYLAKKIKTSWGLEFFVHQKLAKKIYGTLSYSYGSSEAEDKAFSEYSGDFDIRHAFTGVVGYKTSLITNDTYRNIVHKPWFYWTYLIPVNGDEVTFSTRVRYITGRPYTRNTWYAEGVDSPEPIYEGHWETQGHNNERFPDYKRWDFRIDSKYYYGSSALVFYLEIQNLLDNKNIAQFFYRDDGTKDTIYQFRQLTVAGIRYEF